MIGVAIGVFVGSFPVFSTATRGFLITLKQHQYEKAYAMLSPDFQQRNDLPTFIANVKATELDQFESGDFEKEVVAPDKRTGTVAVNMKTKANKVIRVVFYFAMLPGKDIHNKEWRIDNIKFPDQKGAQGAQ